MTRDCAPPAIEPAELVWRDGTPESRQFGDIYFSRHNGLEESRYIFIRHNDLPARFALVPGAGHFVVAETGFGTGLNFLATWQAWQSRWPSHAATLHFVSAERFPLTVQDLEKALSAWPELEDLAQELIANYPPLVRGTHRLVLAGGTVRLTLFFGDVKDAWDSLDFKADAWFLDGFAPAANPEMWRGDIFERIRQHSKPDSTLTTFTAAGAVRRELEAAGFRMQKTAGYGRKRDMLKGILQSPSPVSVTPAAPGKPPTVVVLGAGIAGCLLANNLAKRGFAVSLVDSAGEPGSAASGNLQGALYAKLGVEFNQQTQLALSALTFSQRFYRNNGGHLWHPTGLLQLAWSDSEGDRQRRFILRNQYPESILRPVSREQAEALSGARLESGGLWFPGSGWLEPGALCKALVTHPGIHMVTGFQVARLATSDGKWSLSSGEADKSDVLADRIVICAGHKSPHLIPGCGQLRFRAIRGQVSHVPASMITSPKAVICGARYFNPAHCFEGSHLSVIGATFDLHDSETEPTVESHRKNMFEASAMVPNMLPATAAADETPEHLDGRVGFRCTTHDYQPVAGPFFDAEGLELEGLYLLTGLGSKGLTYAPLLAEFIADRITGQPSALPLTLSGRLTTGRMHKPGMASL